jgi:hypothetical protein
MKKDYRERGAVGEKGGKDITKPNRDNVKQKKKGSFGR